MFLVLMIAWFSQISIHHFYFCREMACYAALLSLFHTLNNIKNHPRPPISFDQPQLHSLTQNLTFFLHFLERYSTKDEGELDSRIAAAAYKAEDVIEITIFYQFHGENIVSVDLHAGLEEVIVEMDLIKKEAMEKMKGSQPHHLHMNPSVSTASFEGQSSAEFDGVLTNNVLDKLTGQQSGLQIIPIVGMGGIGKTTFARYIYSNPLIVQHFDILAWVTISQEYSRGSILQHLYQEIIGGKNDLSEDEMGEIVYKKLCGRRYLIVMDDIWNVEAFDQVKSFFPNGDGRSRIMITTRLSNVAFELSGSHDFQMQFLDADKSWDLLCKTVFSKLDCPLELEDIGKEIARNCRGLPLSIVVIGGLLKKSNMTRIYWEYSLHHLNALINLEDNEYCLQVLNTSYKELPIHLKPCFLYLRVFPEDSEINVSKLIKLWVSEGILKPNDDKSLEDVAKEYLKELMERNLVLVHELRWNGEAKICKIHDLLRDLCFREGNKQKFLCVVRRQKYDIPQDIYKVRRICIEHENTKEHENTNEEYSPELLHALESAMFTRSLLYCMCVDWKEYAPSPSFKVLRVYSPADRHRGIAGFDNHIFEHPNLRYLFLHLMPSTVIFRLPSLFSLLWSIQTLIADVTSITNTPLMVPSEIWEMPLLRHARLYDLKLPDPTDTEHTFVLENLHTLSCVRNLRLSEDVVKRIPNVEKLKLIYRSTGIDWMDELTDFDLINLGRLHKLKSLNLSMYPDRDVWTKEIVRGISVLISLPQSLKKLSLTGTNLYWDEFTTKIGSLPHLQLVRLEMDACSGPKWKTVEGHFDSLRHLHIESCNDLKCWDTDSTHFPRLEHLRLERLENLEEIPLTVGDIQTLKSIQLKYCSKSAKKSAKGIEEEQEEYGNEDLRVVIEDHDSDDEE